MQDRSYLSEAPRRGCNYNNNLTADYVYFAILHCSESMLELPHHSGKTPSPSKYMRSACILVPASSAAERTKSAGGVVDRCISPSPLELEKHG